MTPKETIGKIPFSLAYDTKALASIEISLETTPMEAYNDGNAERQALDLYLIEEKRDSTTT